ncbi:hypothetical protein N9A45_02090 [bacterium]|nr:hypothetical protein [bacterium]
MERAASNAPPPPKVLHTILQWLDKHVREPMQGSVFDTWVATPAKEYYKACKRMN